jgi:hypothetical protein
MLVKHVLAEHPAEPPTCQRVNAVLLAACRSAMCVGELAFRTCPLAESIADKVLAAIAQAEAQAEDDARPVEPDWLASVGFVINGRSARLFPIEMDVDGENCHLGFNFNVNFDVGDTFTRGDVRRLMAALGIPVGSDVPSGAALKQCHTASLPPEP